MSIKDFFLGKSKDYVTGDTDSPEFAIHILKQLQERHTPAIVNFKGDSQQYVTMILEVNERKKIVVLDEMTPKEGHKLAEAGEPFRVTSSDNGIAVVFKTAITKCGIEKGIHYYYVPLPEQVDYLQRREAFRIKISSANKRDVRFKAREKVYKEAYIFDISFTGLSIVVPKVNLVEIVRRGTVLEPVRFELLNDEIMSCQLQIKRVDYNDKKDETIIAGEFKELERHEQRQINALVCNLERTELQQDKMDELE